MRVAPLVLWAGLALVTRSGAVDLQPQVAARIASARAAVAESPGTGEAWGELAMVLHAHGLEIEAYESYLEAMARPPADYRWPYLAALTDRPADAALDLLAKAHALAPRNGPAAHSSAHPRLRTTRPSEFSDTLLAPEDVALSLTYASALTRAGRLDQARAVYRKTGATESARQHAQLGLGRIALVEGRVEDALELLEAERLRTSKNGDLYRLLAQARQQIGDAAGAAEAAWQARSYGAGLRPVSDVVDQMRAQGISAGALLDRGRRLSARGDDEEARALFEEASRLDTSGEALNDLGRVALAQGRSRDAIEHFQAGLQKAPQNADLQVGLADAWLQLGELAATERALALALERRPDHPGAHLALGQLRNRQERFRDAIEPLERALAAEPTRYLAYADLAVAFAGQESFHQALEARRQLAMLAPDHLPNLRPLARLEIELADLGAAKETLRQILGQQPEEIGTAFNLAMLLATSRPISEEEEAESLDLAQRLYSTHRHDAACADLFGIAYAANGRFGDATRVALRARELAQGDPALTTVIDDHLARYAQQRPVMKPLLH